MSLARFLRRQCHRLNLKRLFVYIDVKCMYSISFSVQPCPDVKYGKRIHVLPIDDTVEGLTGYENLQMLSFN